ncbi:MAG: alpha/beta hydrolase family protein [Eubacterium sp.]|jgi:dienelactone hydrolase
MRKGIRIVSVVIVAIFALGLYVYSAAHGYRVTNLTFTTPSLKNGEAPYEYQGLLYEPRDFRVKHPVIIIAHGYNSSMANCEDAAVKYNKAGYAVVLFDFVGGSRKSTTRVHSKDMTTITEVTDMERVLEWVKKQKRFDQSNVFLSGQSFGGLIATMCASRNQDEIRGLVLYYPAYNMVEQAGDYLKKAERTDGLVPWDGLLVSERYLKELHSLDIKKIIQSLTKTDAIIMQGDSDTEVPLKSTEEFVPYFPQVKLVKIIGGEHGFSGTQLDQACKESIGFMNTHLVSS